MNTFNKDDIELSILIPARNEMFLSQTVNDLLSNMRGKTEILVGLDGQWANPGIVDDPRVTIIYVNESIGQRAMTNQLCRLSRAKYVMKIDAHCSVDEGFDVKMMAEMQDDYTMIPTMYNLHAFDWVCFTCGHRIYQGPTPEKCSACGSQMQREIIWKRRESRKSMYYRFDKTLHFQYWGEYGKRPEAQGDVVPIMSAQGSCFMLTREKYWELDICDEKHGSWGQQGVEVACKTWLSGGKLMVNKKTWYAHMFRTQGGDFGFPYPISGRQVEYARKYSRDIWQNNKWDKAIYPFEWLLEKFYPIPDWHDGTEKIDMIKANYSYVKDKKEILFYTDNQLNLKIAHKVQKQLRSIGLPIISVSLKPMDLGKNIHLPLQRGYLTMAKQILAGLEASDAEIIFFAEHDVLYHKSHFDFVPPEKDKYYYNTNVWRVRREDGFALWTDDLQQLSGLVGYRDTLIEHYKERVRRLEAITADGNLTPEGLNRYVRMMGFEPGTHGRPERVDDLKAESFKSEYPNIDIRHDGNQTPNRWRKDQYRNEKYTRGWTESHISKIPGWNIDSL